MKCLDFRCTAAAALLLGGCSIGLDNKYYVRTDGSSDVLTGVAHMVPPRNPPAALDLGVTFKSAGRVSPGASASLYQTVCGGLESKGRWNVHRLGRSADDFGALIQAIVQARAGALPAQPGRLRLLMLVENSPDLSLATRRDYFFSGFTLGAVSQSKPTDRYDVTIAYRDADGVERVYRNHQEMYFTTGSKIFGPGTPGQPGMKAYASLDEAFGGIVDNSVNGSRKGTVTAGKPRLDAAPALAPAPARPVQAGAVAPAAARPTRAAAVVPAAAKPAQVAAPVPVAARSALPAAAPAAAKPH